MHYERSALLVDMLAMFGRATLAIALWNILVEYLIQKEYWYLQSRSAGLL